MKRLFESDSMRRVSDSRKQVIMNDVMLAKRVSLAVDFEQQGNQPPAKPDYAFEPIESNGKFSIYFDKGLTGLDFITELGVEAKAEGTVSQLFFDELEEQNQEKE